MNVLYPWWEPQYSTRNEKEDHPSKGIFGVSRHTFSELSLVLGSVFSEFNESSKSRKKTHNLKGIIVSSNPNIRHSIFFNYMFTSHVDILAVTPTWSFLDLGDPIQYLTFGKKKSKSWSLPLVGRLEIVHWIFPTKTITTNTPHQHQWSETWFPPYRWDRYHISTQLAIYTWYISGIYCHVGDYMVP